MSAFIVSEQCMKNIIYNLFWDHTFKDRNSIFTYNDYRKIDTYEHKDFHKLAEELYKMNQEAVKQRYPDDTSDYINIPDCEKIDWTGNGTKLDKFQALKSMHCLIYQCSEGNIPETKLYKFLSDLVHCWESYIINEMPEYEKAEWD